MNDDSLSELDPINDLAEEFLTRHRRGERPAVTEYATRYPDLAERIRDLFPALLLVEELGSPRRSAAATTKGMPLSPTGGISSGA